jgi:putative spermidine/putrescine transport system ATP-binding protein
MGGEAASLEVSDAEVRYGTTTVLDGISLALAGGEFVALLGSSGCGKTTLLRAICGFVPLSAGHVAVDGRDVTHLPPDKRGTAMVFQSYALWPHMTVNQNIGYGLRLRHVPRAAIAQRVAATLAMLRLDGLGDRLVTALSGGQRQRVALGRALAIDPRLLLLDEPLSNLDARIREEVRHEIKALQKKLGITTIHVTHDREEAMVMADRIVILDAGRIAQIGAPEEVYNHPVSPFVAAFMGAGNVIRLVARPTDGGIAIDPGPHNGGLAIATPALRGDGLGGLGAGGAVVAHFRSEAARLKGPGEPANGSLVLDGEIVQSSYPGGVYRYTVRVGSDQFLVDDARRLGVGDAVALALPVEALHLYVAER